MGTYRRRSPRLVRSSVREVRQGSGREWRGLCEMARAVSTANHQNSEL